jgi:hypothetical protein
MMDTDRCCWDEYQANPTFENMCHFLKHRAWCEMVYEDLLRAVEVPE